ncbi:hypothetical protein [Hymenobacter lapidiphilus]|uniref:Uncharacterized protein n=1 Tax=Hymenobacter lapidiphilus TaxID=2608003 RepID=A0A7Y7PM27_9BACT|nr:hypothetical protein [Hymenobacter lapidiphilus]NVO30287.1 hypothetical protein [Hymenobacter lapidiphilus]
MTALLLFWPAFTALFAWMQGALMPAIRSTPPGPEAKRHDFALHFVGTAAYLLPLVLTLLLPSLWPHLLAALLSRVLLFDVVLNTAAGDAPFAVGRTARTDKLLRKLSPKNPERLSALIRVAALALTAALLLSGCKASQPEPASSTSPGLQVPLPASKNTSSTSSASSRTASLTLPVTTPVAPAPNAPGREHRQYRRNLRAQPRTVPLIQGRAAVNAPAATSVATSYKNAAPVTLATDSAVVNVAAVAKNGQAAAGSGIVQTRTEAPKRTIWQRVTGLFTGLTSTVGWLLLAGLVLHGLAPGVGYGTGWLRRFVSRRRV